LLVSQVFGAATDRAFPHTANALALGLLKAYRKSGEERYVYDDAMKRFLVQKHP